MTTWDKLTENSSAPSGSSALVHLRSQITITETKIEYVKGILTSSVDTNLSSSIDLVLSSSIQNSSLSSNIDTEITTGQTV